MHASDRRGVRAWGAATLLVTALVADCGNPLSPSPAATPTAAPTVSPTPTPAAYADTVRIGFVPGQLENQFAMLQGFRLVSGFNSGPDLYPNRIRLQSTVLAGLYRYDDRFGAVPDLADGPCTPPGDDLTVLRCRLVQTTWHDGTRLTADDVAFAYNIWVRLGWFPTIEEVRVVDPRTVDFVLTEVDGSFMTEVLAGTAFVMQPRHAIEAAYADFAARTKGLRDADLIALADTIDEELGRDPPVCTSRLEEVETLLGTIGVQLYREDFSLRETGAFDACAYLGAAGGWIRATGEALMSANPLDVAVQQGLLSISRSPIGAGPYRLVSESAGGIHLEAWPGYHGGFAATRYLDFVPTTADGSAVADGTIDILQRTETFEPAYRATAGSLGVRVAIHAGLGLAALAFNVRKGRPFAERDLRLALQLCVDLERDVDAATRGAGVAIISPILPGSWAADPDLPKRARDVAAGRELIEDAGWRLGADGTYAKGGARLAADIVVRGDWPDRVKMADLIALQARDCGMDLRTRPLDVEDIFALGGVLTYPHTLPGTDTPFDLYLGGQGNTPDPRSAIDGLASSQASDAEHPQTYNYMGFADPVLDRLLEDAAATYDQDERARLYRMAQRELAAQLPMLYLWCYAESDALRTAVSSVDGPLDLTMPNWAWQPERLVVRKSGS